MKKNRILVLSSLVSLIPLASISVVSCNKKKTEEDVNTKPETKPEEDVNAKLTEAVKAFNFIKKGTISDDQLKGVEASSITTEQQLLQYFDFVGKIEGITYTFIKAEPFKNDPTYLVVTYEFSYKTAQKQTGTIYLKGFKSKIDNILPPNIPDIPGGEVDQDQNQNPGTGGGTGGSGGGGTDNGGTTNPTEGILTIRGSQLGATHTDKSV
ncbi:MAG: hypothetical protein IKG27_06520 [Bacilli bacterium]|nr:hypothetical protein [Bacilli bacterium]